MATVTNPEPQPDLRIDTLAEAYYGQAATGPTRDFAGVNYQRTEDGYFILDTGNRVMDAIGSVALNELGVDNFVNAVEAAQGGSYGRAMRQLAFGVAELGLNAFGIGVAARGATRAAIAIGRNAGQVLSSARRAGGLYRGLFKPLAEIAGMQRIIVKNSLGYAKYVAGMQNSTLGRLSFRYGTGRHTARAARAANLYWDDVARSFRSVATGRRVAPPSPAPGIIRSGLRRTPVVGTAARGRRADIRNVMRTNATAPTRAQRIPMGTQRANYLLGRPVPGVNVPGAGGAMVAGVRPAAGFLGSPLARRTAGGLVGAEVVQFVDANLEANRNAEAAARQQTPGNWERNVEGIRAEAIARQVDDALSAATPPSDGAPAPDPDIDDLDTNAQAALSAIQTQYGRAVGELRSMYELAETEDEKERLRFVLSDIQAQADAGREAIMNVYERNRKQVSELSAQSKAAAIEAAQKALDNYEMSAASLQDQLDANFAAAAGDAYGFGAAIPREQSEYVQLLSAMAPVASQYRQAIGDISTEGLEWMGATMGEQAAARQADLTRLALSTRAAATSQHKQAVDKRIAAERLALAEAMESLMNQQMQQSGANYRALLSQQGTQEEPERWTPTQAIGYLEGLALKGNSIDRIMEEYAGLFAGRPNAFGTVWPEQLPTDFRNRIIEAMALYQRTKSLEEGGLALQEQELADAGQALVPGATS